MNIYYCKNCVMPNTKPKIYFNEEGICGACLNHKKKQKAKGLTLAGGRKLKKKKQKGGFLATLAGLIARTLGPKLVEKYISKVKTNPKIVIKDLLGLLRGRSPLESLL